MSDQATNISKLWYDNLSNNKSAHRLVRLLPQKQGKSLECELITVHAESASPYHALSYCWGSTRKDKVIILRTRETKAKGSFHVTENLYSFLKTIANVEYSQWLYIDAICIDQDNLEERAHQVRMMGDIYRNAQKVLVWLGTDSEIEYLFRWLLENTVKLDLLDYMTNQDRSEMSHALQQDTALIRGYNSIINNVYWSRLWIVQEMRQGRVLDIQCNQITVRCDTLYHFQRMFSSSLPYYDHESGMLRLLSNKMIQSHRELEMYWYISGFKTQKCSDPRDKIYGLLSLAKDGKEFPIDYTISTEELFFKAWVHFDFSHREDMTRSLLQALELDMPLLLAYAKNLGNLKETNIGFHGKAFIQPGQMANCLCGFKLMLDSNFRTRKYAIWCAAPGIKEAPPHILFKLDEDLDTKSPGSWNVVGLIESDEFLSTPNQRRSSRPQINTSLLSSDDISVNPDPEYRPPFELSDPDASIGSVDVEINRLGLATLLNHVMCHHQHVT